MAAVVPFVLAPVLANEDIINYTMAEGAKLYHAAVEALPGDAFNCEPHGIKVFLATLEDQAIRSGWMHILMIPQDADDPTNLLHNYGHFTLQQVRDHAVIYIDQQDHMAQDNAQLYDCLMNSLSKEARVTSGPALLKVIIWESHVDMHSTILHVREKLSSLDSYIATINYDISKFNVYVKDLVDSLTARGHGGAPTISAMLYIKQTSAGTRKNTSLTQTLTRPRNTVNISPSFKFNRHLRLSKRAAAANDGTAWSHMTALGSHSKDFWPEPLKAWDLISGCYHEDLDQEAHN